MNLENDLENYSIQGDCSILIKNNIKEDVLGPQEISILKIRKFKYQICTKNLKNSFIIQFYPLQDKYYALYQMDNKQKNLIFYFPLSSKKLLKVVCEIKDQQLSLFTKFREMYCRCVYQQNKNQKSSEIIEEKDKTEKLFIYIKKIPQGKECFENMINIENYLKNKELMIYLQVGYFCKMEINNEDGYNFIKGILFIQSTKDGDINLSIINSNNILIYSQILQKNFEFSFDHDQKQVVWTDDNLEQDNKIFCFYLKLATKDEIQDLEDIIVNIQQRKQQTQKIIKQNQEIKFQNSNNFLTESIQQSNKKQSFTNNNYLLNQSNKIQLQSNNKYLINNKNNKTTKNRTRQFLFNSDEDYSDDDQKQDNQINNTQIVDFQQLKKNNKLMVVREGGVQLLSKQNLSLQTTCQIMDQSNKQFTPSNIHILQNNHQFISMNHDKTGQVYFVDLPKEKIIRSYQDNQYQNLLDLSVLNEKSMPSQNNFIALGQSSIQQFDTRDQYSVRSKYYKTIYDFTHIFSPSLNNYITLTENGDVRCYSSVGENAKNKLDSFAHKTALHLDSNKKGDLILVTYDDQLYLYPMNQGAYNAFRYTMKRNAKPKPFNLKINQRELHKKGALKVKIKSAKFDEKQQERESQIIAILEPNLIAFWNLDKVIKEGDIETSQINILNDQIVKGEFLYDSNSIVTAFKKDIKLNSFQ